MTETICPGPVIKHFEDLQFTVVVTVTDEYRAEFQVYKIEAWDTAGKPMWHQAGITYSPCPVANLAEAEAFLHGNVKWDGCSNWYFDEQDRLMLHGCTREQLQHWGEVMARCWDLASELIPRFAG